MSHQSQLIIERNYYCKPCSDSFITISELHKHLEEHVTNSSYIYNHVLKTAYLLNDYPSSHTQTNQTDDLAMENSDIDTKSSAENKRFDDIDIQTEKPTALCFTYLNREDQIIKGDPPSDNDSPIQKSPVQAYETGEVVIKQETLFTEDNGVEENDTEDYLIKPKIRQKKVRKKNQNAAITQSLIKRKKSSQFFVEGEKVKRKGRPPKYTLPDKEMVVLDKVQCDICDLCFMSLMEMSKHVYEVHTHHLFKCCLCWNAFLYESELQTHLQTHVMISSSHRGTKKMWQCDMCSRGCSSYNSYLVHKKTVHSKERVKCDICDMDFSKAQSLHKHKIEQHFVKITGHYCESCKRQFAYRYHYEKHMILVHKDLTYATQTYICEKCGYQTFDISLLNAHKQSCLKEKLLKCNDCEYTTYRRSSLHLHKVRHNAEKNHMCHYCGVTFRKRSALDAHQRTHTGEKPYKCEICDRCFSFESPYLRHLKLHQQGKEHTCTYCGKEFHQLSNCRAHMRQHTGEKPYKCDYCQQGFAHNVSRKKHMMKCSQHMSNAVNLTLK